MTIAQDPLQTLLLGYLSDWQIQLQSMAVSGALLGAASQSLEVETAPSYLRDLNTRLAAGDWSDLPQVELLESEGMGGVVDAWTSSTQIIYLNSDWLSSASSIQVATLLTEKFIDSFCVPSEREDAVACEPEPISRIIAGEGVNGNFRLAIDSDGWWDVGSAEFDAAESTFGVDANQDGIIGPLKNLDATGDITLASDSVGNLFASGTAIKQWDGTQIYSGIYGTEWTTLAAETIDGVNTVLWMHESGALHTWQTDDQWQWTSSDGWWDVGSAEFDAAESTFGVDANQDGIIGPLKNLNSNSSPGSSTQDEFDILTNYTNITCVMPPNAWSTIHANKQPQIIDCFDPQVGIICVCPGIACDNPPFLSEFNSDLTSTMNQDFTQVLRPLSFAI